VGWLVGGTGPLIYLFAPLLFQALEKRKAKIKKIKKEEEECKRERKGYRESTSRYKEEELAGGYDHEVNYCSAAFWEEELEVGEGRGGGGEKCFVRATSSHPRILKKTQTSYGWRQSYVPTLLSFFLSPGALKPVAAACNCQTKSCYWPMQKQNKSPSKETCLLSGGEEGERFFF